MGRPVVHWEMNSANPAATAEFYTTVFEWEIQHIPEMDYRLVNTGGTGGIGGGIAKPEDPQAPATALYIDVDDLGAYARKIVDAGGTMILENQEVPGMGSISLFLDPDHRLVGLWKAAS
jgi:predicted enzyme related to lactoylglutathione lyase